MLGFFHSQNANATILILTRYTNGRNFITYFCLLLFIFIPNLGMTQNNWFRNITTIVKSKPEVRNTFLMVFIILYFGFRDYKQNQTSEMVIQSYKDLADRDAKRADKCEEKYDRLLDRTLFDKEKQNNLKDTISIYLKRLEEKLQKNDK